MNNYHLLLMEINIHTMRKRQKQSTRNRLIIDNRNSQNTCWAMLKEVKNKIKIKVFNQSIDQLVLSKKKKKIQKLLIQEIIVVVAFSWLIWIEMNLNFVKWNENETSQQQIKSSQINSEYIFFPFNSAILIQPNTHRKKRLLNQSKERKNQTKNRREGGEKYAQKKKNHRSKWSLVFSFFLF